MILEIMKAVKKLGPVYTMWFGNEPMVVITDIDIARDLFRKNDIAGRPKQLMCKYCNIVCYECLPRFLIIFLPVGTELVCNDKRADVICNDYGHQWEALRRVAHSAVQCVQSLTRLQYPQQS